MSAVKGVEWWVGLELDTVRV